jgi:hypothetical protein
VPKGFVRKHQPSGAEDLRTFPAEHPGGVKGQRLQLMIQPPQCLAKAQGFISVIMMPD